MKTIIAEKPSVAREIARIVGATKREEGYFSGNGYAVTWAYGGRNSLIIKPQESRSSMAKRFGNPSSERTC